MSDTLTASAPSVVYTSKVHVEPGASKLKLVTLPHEAEPVPMGVHGPIAAHYKLPEGSFVPRASTLDYIVGATAGCLMGTLNSALLARRIETAGHLTADAFGEIETEDGVLVIRRIRLLVRLRAPAAAREAVERVVASYATQCPVYRSLAPAIAITTELDFQEQP